MSWKKAIAKTYFRFSKWTCVTEPLPEKVVVIGGPHTSNWDGFFMVMAFWAQGRDFKFLVKDSLLKNPLTAPIVRGVGGIAVNRSKHNGIVSGLVAEAGAADEFTLIIAPKGTRQRRDYWKSGFYSICYTSGLPLQLGFIDRSTMTYGWAETMQLSGDVVADMDKIRAFYDGKLGHRPEYGSVPRLRAEDDEAARKHLLGES